MLQSSLLSIILAALGAILLAGFQYFFRRRRNLSSAWVLAFCRAGAIFCLLLLLINPEIETTEYSLEKPRLLLAVDNSASIENFDQAEDVRKFVNSLLQSKALSEGFDISTYSFGTNLNPADSFSFSEPQTNLHQALEVINRIHQDRNGASVVISDGNQTLGRDYRYGIPNFSQAVFPVVVGDTTRYQDLAITRINTNTYAFLDNRFPVEIFVRYAGEGSVNSELKISRNEIPVFTEQISMDAGTTSSIVRTNLPASQVGPAVYKVEISPLEKEKNTVNNERNFSVEVIDQRSKVLVVSDLSHPDLGALKKSISSNQQREVVLVKSSEVPIDLEKVAMAILYQPGSEFKRVFERLETAGKNYWIITGPETDWRFLNEQQEFFRKKLSAQIEEYFPVLNENFISFQVDELGFSSFPPLVDRFGELNPTEGIDILLLQEVQGITTQQPLLATFETPSRRGAFLFGANLWRWRSEVFVNEGSFQSFDDFIGSLVQYLSSGKKRDRLAISYENFYLGNQNLLLSAEYFDKTYRFDPRGNLRLDLVNTLSSERKQVPLKLSENVYEANLRGLPPGEYQFSISVEGENLSRSGAFTVAAYEVEDQFVNANLTGLHQLAARSGGELYFLDQAEELVLQLLKDKNYVPVQKSRQKRVYLVDWYYLLALVVLFLSTEWFLRKYHGFI